MTNLERMRLAAANKPVPGSAPPTLKIVPPQGGSGTATPQQPKKKVGYIKKLDLKFDKSRLPDGSSFAVRYSALAVRWIGTLTVPRPDTGKEPKVFHGEASGVFKLLSVLDRQYRDWLDYKAKQLTQPPPPQ